MAKIMTKSCHFDTKNIFVSDAELQLPLLQCLYKSSSQMTYPVIQIIYNNR